LKCYTTALQHRIRSPRDLPVHVEAQIPSGVRPKYDFRASFHSTPQFLELASDVRALTRPAQELAHECTSNLRRHVVEAGCMRVGRRTWLATFTHERLGCVGRGMGRVALKTVDFLRRFGDAFLPTGSWRGKEIFLSITLLSYGTCSLAASSRPTESGDTEGIFATAHLSSLMSYKTGGHIVIIQLMHIYHHRGSLDWPGSTWRRYFVAEPSPGPLRDGEGYETCSVIWYFRATGFVLARLESEITSPHTVLNLLRKS
jgi:hypothetical protein